MGPKSTRKRSAEEEIARLEYYKTKTEKIQRKLAKRTAAGGIPVYTAGEYPQQGSSSSSPSSVDSDDDPHFTVEKTLVRDIPPSAPMVPQAIHKIGAEPRKEPQASSAVQSTNSLENHPRKNRSTLEAQTSITTVTTRCSLDNMEKANDSRNTLRARTSPESLQASNHRTVERNDERHSSRTILADNLRNDSRARNDPGTLQASNHRAVERNAERHSLRNEFVDNSRNEPRARNYPETLQANNHFARDRNDERHSLRNELADNSSNDPRARNDQETLQASNHRAMDRNAERHSLRNELADNSSSDPRARIDPETFQISHHDVMERNDERRGSRNELADNSRRYNPRRRTSPDTSQASNHRAMEQNNEQRSSKNKLADSSRNDPRTKTTHADDSINNSVMDESAELLNAFENDFLSGEIIHSKLPELWDPVLRKGLPKYDKELLQKKYTTPDNCKLLKSPILNVEACAVLGAQVKKRDKNLQKKQDELGLAITAIARGMTLILNHSENVSKQYEMDAMKHFNHGCFLLADIHFEQTRTRRFLCGVNDPAMHQYIQEKIDILCDRDDTLYGQKTGKLFKKFKSENSSTLDQWVAPSTTPGGSSASQNAYPHTEPRHQPRKGANAI